MTDLPTRIENARPEDVRGLRELDDAIADALYGRQRMLAAKHYTTSVDAALLLVPEGWVVERMGFWPGSGAWCHLYGTHDHKGERWHHISDGRVEARAPTLAQAIAAAALRAKEPTT